MVADKVTFPLKHECERVNATLEDIKDIASSTEGPESLEMVDVDSPKPKLRYIISKGYVHYSEGTAGNGNIHVDDDDGYNVKLDKLGVDDTKSGLVGPGKFPHQTFWGYLQRLGSE